MHAYVTKLDLVPLVCENDPCHAEYYHVLHSSLIDILLTYSIPVMGMYHQSEWKSVWILISKLRKKPADLDLYYFQK